MERYANAISDEVFSYMAVGASEESPEELVIVLGYPDTKVAEYADGVSGYLRKKFNPIDANYFRRVTNIWRRRRSTIHWFRSDGRWGHT